MILKRTREQKRHDTQAPKNKVDSIRKVVITPSGENAFVILLRGVNDKVYNLIFKTLGIDISGYSHTLDSSAVKHALNRHKNDEVPLTIEHLSLIPDILKNADSKKRHTCWGVFRRTHKLLTGIIPTNRKC